MSICVIHYKNGLGTKSVFQASSSLSMCEILPEYLVILSVFLLNQTRSKIDFSPFFFLPSVRLTQYLPNAGPSFTHNSTPFSSAHFHDMSVSNHLHFDNCQSCQQHREVGMAGPCTAHLKGRLHCEVGNLR